MPDGYIEWIEKYLGESEMNGASFKTNYIEWIEK